MKLFAERSALAIFPMFLLVMIAIAFPASSDAATIEVRSCHQGATNASSLSGDNWGAGSWSKLATIRAEKDCPSGLFLHTSKPATIGESNRFHFVMDRALPLDSVRLSYSTEGPATGYRYTLHKCTDCEAFEELLPTGGSEVETETFPLELSTSFVVRAECVVAACLPSGHLRIKSIVFRLTDVEPPTLSTASLFSGWSKRADIRPRFRVFDVGGFGGGRVTARLDGQPEPFWVEPGCSLEDVSHQGWYYGPALKCEWGHEFWEHLDLRGVPDGQNTIIVNARDGVGNEMSPWSGTFKVDDTAPSTPEALTVAPTTGGGWTASPAITLGWRNAGESVETATESGLAQAHYELRPRDPASLPTSGLVRFWPTSDESEIPEVELGADGAFDLYVWTVDRVGNVSGKLKGFVGRDIDAPTPPSLHPQSWLSRESLVDGVPLQWDRPDTSLNESGICGYGIMFTGSKDASPTSTITHHGDVVQAMIPANLEEGSNWAHVRAVSCAGLASPTTSTELKVDATPPNVRISGNVVDRWLGANASLAIEAVDEASGVRAVDYSVDGGTSVSSADKNIPLTLTDGDQVVAARATDQAGNTTDWAATRVKLDRTAPDGTFQPREAANPTLLKARLRDTTAGLASAEIQILNSGAPGARWQPVPGDVHVSVGGPKHWDVQTILDDLSLPAGMYRARVVASDHAGNSSVIDDVSASGVPMTFSLPARRPTRITASIATIRSACKPLVRRGCKGRKKCTRGSRRCKNVSVVETQRARRSRTVGYGVATALVGRLTYADGSPIGGSSLAVSASVLDSAPSRLGAIVTNPRGEFQFRVPRGPNRRFTVSFAGSPTQLPVSATADLGMQSSATLRVRSKSVGGGREFWFHGRLRGNRAEYRANRVLAVLEFRNGRVWQTAIGRATVDQIGRFSVGPYPVRRGSTGPKRIRVRAFIRSEGTSWPYQDGVSNAISVKLRR